MPLYNPSHIIISKNSFYNFLNLDIDSTTITPKVLFAPLGNNPFKPLSISSKYFDKVLENIYYKYTSQNYDKTISHIYNKYI
jgi:hypothetical protein